MPYRDGFPKDYDGVSGGGVWLVPLEHFQLRCSFPWKEIRDRVGAA
jgi:hypothetical protein